MGRDYFPVRARSANYVVKTPMVLNNPMTLNTPMTHASQPCHLPKAPVFKDLYSKEPVKTVPTFFDFSSIEPVKQQDKVKDVTPVDDNEVAVVDGPMYNLKEGILKRVFLDKMEESEFLIQVSEGYIS